MPYIAISIYFLGLNIGIIEGLWPSFAKESISVISALLLITASTISIPKTKYIFFLFSLLATSIFSYLFIDSKFHQDVFLLNLYLAIAFLVYSFFVKKENYKYFNIFLILLSASGIFNVIIQFIQLLFSPIHHYGIILPLQGTRPYGNIGQPNNLGTLLTICLILPALINNKKILNSKYCRLGIIIYSLLITIGISLTDSRTALISLITMIAWTFVNSGKNGLARKILTFSFLFIITTKYLLQFNSSDRTLIPENISSNRFDLWSMMLEASLKNPLFGFGFNRIQFAQFEVIENYSTWWHILSQQSHNLIIDFVVWFGYPLGLLLAFLFFRIFIRKKFFEEDYIIFALLIPLLIHSLFEYPLHYIYFLYIFSAILGRFDSKSHTVYVLPKKLTIPALTPLYLLSLSVFFEYINIEASAELQALSHQTKTNPSNVEFYNATTLDSLSSNIKSIGFYNYSYEWDTEKLEYLVKLHPNNMNYEALINIYLKNGEYSKASEWILKREYYIIK